MYKLTETTYNRNPNTNCWESIAKRSIELFATLEEAKAHCLCELKFQRCGWNGRYFDTEYYVEICA